ncbi:uncharacterized protein LOC113362218 [Papaver somniferum]|uniref:uncharacterized protein LOC113362218 n=1 Tax=Papaver somniferum TaxID=3469 RepID=UPI000E6FFC9B|nr:uncharacterized protein LOC113362218 [Papaver somniferum]
MGVRRRGKPAVVAEGRKYVYPDECKYWTDAEKVVFRAARIGHLLDIPDDQKMSGPIFSFLMIRWIHVPEDEEIWFKVGENNECIGLVVLLIPCDLWDAVPIFLSHYMDTRKFDSCWFINR